MNNRCPRKLDARHASYRYDTATGLYYCWNRYYVPELARFLTRDIYPGELSDPVTMNPYLYCGGDPVNAVDPSGNAHVAGGGGGLTYGESLDGGQRVVYGLGGVLCIAGGKMIQGIGGKIAAKGIVMVGAGLGLSSESGGTTGGMGVAAGGCTVAAGASVWVAGATVDESGNDLMDMAVSGQTQTIFSTG